MYYQHKIILHIQQELMISNSGASCYNANNDSEMCDITEINELVLGNSGNMEVAIKGKLYVKLRPFDWSEFLHILWTVKYCKKVEFNLFFCCKLLEQSYLSSDHKNNIKLDTENGYFLLD